jgi:hypothetical protein
MAPRSPQQAAMQTTAPRSRYEIWTVAALCALAAARILFGAAALPFFADTDEQVHFDLAHKFARGYWPKRHHEIRDPETIVVTLYHHSPEFSFRPELWKGGRMPPPVRDWPRAEQDFYVAWQLPGLRSEPNHEAHSPPVYYALAGIWYDFGRALGLSGPGAVYWVRFLNVPLYGSLVFTAYAFARPYFGRDTALAVAALTAFFPNTVFFTINSDILSPLLASLTLILLLRWYESEDPSRWLASGIGAMAAATVLVKLTNVALLVAVAAVILLRLRRTHRLGRTLRESWLMLLTAGAPLLLWGVRNRLVLGDWTGTSSKLEQLHWTPKPFSEWLDHPMFKTGASSSGYLTKLASSFFDGDANWHNHAARSAVADNFFLATSAVLPLIGLMVAMFRGFREPPARFGAGLSALTVLTFLGLLTWLSIRFDFGDCAFPSRDFPFLASGRLIAGGLVPFLALYAYGLESLAGRRPAWVAAAVAATVSMMVLAQQPFLKLALGSQYNWFHLP